MCWYYFIHPHIRFKSHPAVWAGKTQLIIRCITFYIYVGMKKSSVARHVCWNLVDQMDKPYMRISLQKHVVKCLWEAAPGQTPSSTSMKPIKRPKLIVHSSESALWMCCRLWNAVTWELRSLWSSDVHTSDVSLDRGHLKDAARSHLQRISMVCSFSLSFSHLPLADVGRVTVRGQSSALIHLSEQMPTLLKVILLKLKKIVSLVYCLD